MSTLQKPTPLCTTMVMLAHLHGHKLTWSNFIKLKKFLSCYYRQWAQRHKALTAISARRCAVLAYKGLRSGRKGVQVRGIRSFPSFSSPLLPWFLSLIHCWLVAESSSELDLLCRLLFSLRLLLLLTHGCYSPRILAIFVHDLMVMALCLQTDVSPVCSDFSSFLSWTWGSGKGGFLLYHRDDLAGCHI